MLRIFGSELKEYVNNEVKVAGWVHNIRQLGQVNFLNIRDLSGVFQVVIEALQTEQVKNLYPEDVIEVEGIVVQEPQAPGGFEIHNPRITVLAQSSEELPFLINKPKLPVRPDTFLNFAALGLRHPQKQAIFRLSSGCMAGFRQTLDKRRFVEITSPKIVASATESGANVFSIRYFGRTAYLAQSPQFYKQIMVGVFERVYEVAPVFRAEPHATARHLNEYVSMDVEMGFIHDHFDVMNTLSGVIKGIFSYLEVNYSAELSALGVVMPLIPENFPHIYFPEAQQLIYDIHGVDCRGEHDLAPQHERWLGEWAKEKYQSDFLFVTGYPIAKRPFYTHPSGEAPQYSNSFDLLFRGVELVTGGQRLHKYEDYLKSLERSGIANVEAFEGYLQAFKFGMPPHGGFAIGLERLVMQLIGAQNLRETTLFPRDLNRLSP